MASAEQFFDFAAEVGFTKHMGGVEATEELVELCHIGEGSYVLDVGCGAGATAVYLVQRHGCRVAGVDILPRMVERARETARREGVEDRTEFRVADAQDLPFDDDMFDAVITESVAAFPEDKQRAANEYVRVTKPGGYVGLNESTWLQAPPPPEMVAWVAQEVGAQVKPLTREEWVGLLEHAGLKDIVARVRHIDTRHEAGGMMRRYGCLGMLRVWGRMLRLYVKNPAYRQFVKRVGQGGITPKNLDQYFGYGLYVGRK
ncbi:MAG: class I SAM-dependent methyltransferase [Anaerolineae bacterium]|nr:class I SAM-dependent methyltransferase [Anaerolineae bacterium]